MSESIRKSHDYSGTYRGVAFLARMTEREAIRLERYSYEAKELWTHYIFICEQQVPEALRERFFLEPKLERIADHCPERVIYHYADSALADLEWHCGITYYDLVCAVPGHRVLKAGCDYQHLYDDGMSYNEAWVIHEAKQTIDSLWDQLPSLLVRDWKTGEWVTPEKATPENAIAAPSAAGEERE